jgi:predicted nuclease of predicted toxin-antitoxin system
MKILLDENVPVDVLFILRGAGHQADSVNFLGWKGLKNGALIQQAQANYDLFLTRDKDFEEPALIRYVSPDFGIVLLAIPQQRGAAYAKIFAALWPANPLTLTGCITRLAA